MLLNECWYYCSNQQKNELCSKATSIVSYLIMKTALIFGSSGLIGKKILNIIIQNKSYSKVKIFVRALPENNNSKVEIIKTDFNNLEKHRDSIVGNVCFFCIGTTKKDTPDNDDYRRVEYNIPINVARIAKENLIESFIK